MPDVLLDTAPVNNYRKKLKRWAEAVVALNIQDTFGVEARRLGTAGMGIYLSAHDNKDRNYSDD